MKQLYGVILTISSCMSHAAPFIFSTNRGSNNITPIYGTNNTTRPNIPTAAPRGIRISYDQSKAYVVNNAPSGTLTPINITNGNFIPQTPIALGNFPNDVAVTSDNTFAIVNSSNGTVYKVDLTTSAVSSMAVGASFYLAITPDDTTVYMTSGSNVIPINVASFTAGSPISVGGNTFGIAITSDGSKAIVANSGSSAVQIINLMTNMVTTIGLPNRPEGIALTPDESFAYVTCQSANVVIPVNLITQMVGSSIAITNPQGIAITTIGTTPTAYVINGGVANTVTPINLMTNTLGSPIPIGSAAERIAIAEIVPQTPPSAGCREIALNFTTVLGLNSQPGNGLRQLVSQIAQVAPFTGTNPLPTQGARQITQNMGTIIGSNPLATQGIRQLLANIAPLV